MKIASLVYLRKRMLDLSTINAIENYIGVDVFE